MNARPDELVQLIERVHAAGGPELLFDVGTRRAIALGYVVEHGRMIRLLPHGKVALDAAAKAAGLNASSELYPALAMSAWLLELVDTPTPTEGEP